MGDGALETSTRIQGLFAHPVSPLLQFRSELNVPLTASEGIREKMWGSALLVPSLKSCRTCMINEVPFLLVTVNY